MKVVVEAWEKKFRRLMPSIKKNALKLGRFLGLKDSYVEIYLVGDNFMRKNVLSFPAPKGMPRPDLGGKKALGEIYLNPDYIRKEKLEIRNLKLEIFSQRLKYMLIHGLLHLLDYDHKKRNDRIVMERKEAELLSKL